MCDPLSNVSVVISVYSIDRANNVADCIESLKKQSLAPKEIVVVLDPAEELSVLLQESVGFIC